MCQIPLTPQELNPGHPVLLVLLRPFTGCVSKPFRILVEQHEESNKFCPCQNLAPIRIAAKSKQEPLEGPSSGNRRRNTRYLDSKDDASSAKKMRQESTSPGLQEVSKSMKSDEESDEDDEELLAQRGATVANKIILMILFNVCKKIHFQGDRVVGGEALPGYYADPEPAPDDEEETAPDDQHGIYFV